MNLGQILNTFARAAIWQLARRSPTWALILIVIVAAVLGGHHH